MKDSNILCQIKAYNIAIEKIRPIIRSVILWSFISLLYIYGDLRLNISETDSGESGMVTPWGLPIIGITDNHILVFLLIMTLYFWAKFLFCVIKIHLSIDFCVMVRALFSQESNTERHFAWFEYLEDDNLDHERNTRLFLVNYPIIRFLDYFFAPIIFPVILSSWALISIVRKASIAVLS